MENTEHREIRISRTFNAPVDLMWKFGLIPITVFISQACQQENIQV